MKSLLPVTAMLALFSPASALAGNLTIPMSFEYLAMDGKTIESSVFNHKAELALAPGEHKIAIRYNEMVEDDFTDGQSFVKSAPFIVTLMATQDGEYRLKPAGTNEVKYPQKFAKAPQVEIISDNSSKVAYSVEYTNLEQSSFFSRLLGDNTGVNLNHAAVVATSAAVVAPASQPDQGQYSQVNTAAAPADTQATTTDSAAQAEQMLQYWWLQASEETRKQFMSWAIKQL